MEGAHANHRAGNWIPVPGGLPWRPAGRRSGSTHYRAHQHGHDHRNEYHVQRDDDGTPRIVEYYSHALTAPERRYTTSEQEALELGFSLGDENDMLRAVVAESPNCFKNPFSFGAPAKLRARAVAGQGPAVIQLYSR